MSPQTVKYGKSVGGGQTVTEGLCVGRDRRREEGYVKSTDIYL